MFIFPDMEKDSLLQRIKEGIQDTCYIWAKEIRSTIADEGVLIFCILVPLLYPLIYSWIYNNEVVREVPVTVVDLSHSNLSRQFIRDFDASPDTRVAYYCNSLDEAKALTGKQKVHGTIYIPSDFETKVYRHEQATIGVYTDMSLILTYKAIYLTAQAVSSRINTEIQIKQLKTFTDHDEEVTTHPLEVDEVPIFNTTGGYGNAILPGVLMLIIQQTLLLGIGLAAGTARENNRFQDLVPVSRHYNGIFRIVLGKSMCYFMLYAVMGTYLALVIPKLFGFISLVTAGTIAGFLIPYILSCIFFGMMISCLVRYRENVMLLVVFTTLPFLFMTGLSWPQTSIPGFWQGVSTLIPSTYGVRGFLRISSMGATLADIQTEYRALWIQTFAYFVLTCAVYRYQINSTRKRAYQQIQMLKEKIREAKEKKSSGSSTASTLPSDS